MLHYIAKFMSKVQLQKSYDTCAFDKILYIYIYIQLFFKRTNRYIHVKIFIYLFRNVKLVNKSAKNKRAKLTPIILLGKQLNEKSSTLYN